jgi:hypothetical protein
MNCYSILSKSLIVEARFSEVCSWKFEWPINSLQAVAMELLSGRDSGNCRIEMVEIAFCSVSAARARGIVAGRAKPS